MFPLRAVIPDGFSVIDHDGVSWSRRCVGLDRHVSREEARDGRVDVVDGNTGLVECGLNDRVILEFRLGPVVLEIANGREIYLGPKLELNQVPSLSLKVIRLEFEVAVLVRNLDDVRLDRSV